MTFLNAPLALDGARTPAALVRKGEYADTSGAEGIVERADLKVTPGAGGSGLLIAPGNGLVLNRYQTTVNETYVVANPGVHTVLPASMPTSQPSAKSYLVLITVGDPEFSQTGHPWMPSEPLDPEEAAEYTYVKPWLYEVPAGTTEYAGVFPALVLARLDIPANTTTILAGYLTDLRAMARPRVQEELYIDNSGIANTLDAVAPAWEGLTGSNPIFKIPKWASIAKIQGVIESCVHSKATNGSFRVVILGTGSVATAPSLFNRSAPTSGADRSNINFGGQVNVAALAGESRTFQVQGSAAAAPSAGGLASDVYTSTFIRVRFEEAPI